MRPLHSDLQIERQPLNLYGSLEKNLQQLRDHRPLDLNAEQFRQHNPSTPFEMWQAKARECLEAALHYDPGLLDLQAETITREKRNGLIIEKIAFNTTPWFRVNGYFLYPMTVALPLPALVVFHAWGGPMLFGKERIVNTGRDHPALQAHRAKVYSGNYLAEEFAKAGFAVMVIDAHHFGERAPRGLPGIPEAYDPFSLDANEFAAIHEATTRQLYLGVRQLNWAGTTWMGVNYWDDRRCIDYLLTRPEVDPERIGCTGLSGGGWRTNILAALDTRVKAAVSGMWMTTGDYQQVYNLSGAIGVFCLLPGVWNRLDVPDLTAMSVPCASMVISGSEDPLFPPEGQLEAARQIGAGYQWAGCPERFKHLYVKKPHCYDAELQQAAIAWFSQHLW